MLNQYILVGKVSNFQNKEETVIVTINITRINQEDISDDIDITLSNHLRKTALEHLSIGATIGVKAKITNKEITIANETVKTHAIIAEKITFINARNSD
jgi:hypothetical protein